MKLMLCQKHNAMTYHEEDTLVGWYCLKCKLEECQKITLNQLNSINNKKVV